MNLNELQQIVDKKPKGITRLSMECILTYLYSSRRLCLSIFYPKIRPIEKGIPLVVKNLEIYDLEIIIDKIILQVRKDKSIEVAFSDLFTRRKQFEVTNLKNKVQFPFKINIKVGTAIVEPDKGLFARNYSNITGTIKNVHFIGLNRREELRLPWVQNVDRVESIIIGENRFFATLLPNILTKKIFINFTRNTRLCLVFIRGWCMNKTRAVGSELILTTSPPEEDTYRRPTLLSAILDFLGFVRHDDDSLRLPMDNNSEVVIRKTNGKVLFTPLYLEKTNFQNYLHLTVQHKQP